MNILWINRIIAMAVYLISIYICEKYKLTPWVCFTYAICMLIGLNFIFDIVEIIMKK